MDLGRSIVPKLALAVVVLILISNILFIRRDYQDSWILEGLEFPFILFVLTYVAVFFSEKKISTMIALGIIGRIIFLLVPSLKYIWFQGVWIDQHQQYALASYVVDHGRIIHGIEAFGAKVYSSTPSVHLAFSIFSIVPDIPVAEALKYLPVFLAPLYPLLTYFILVRMKMPFKTTGLRYALFISSIPLSEGQYLVTGHLFSGLLVLLILSCFVALFYGNDRRYLLLLVILIIVLATAHSSSSLLLVASLLAVMLLQKVNFFRIESYKMSSIILLNFTACIAWLSFPARFTLESILKVLVFRVPSGMTPKSGAVPVRFFELLRTDVFSSFQVLLVQHGADALLLLLTLVGLVILLRSWRKIGDATKFFCIFVIPLFVFMGVGILLKVGAFRPLFFIHLTFPIFFAVFILHVNRRQTKWIPTMIFSVMVSLVILQLYPCQPLVPSANVLSLDLSADEPLFYATEVNSIYQRDMIFFASNHIMKGRIACDRITRNQILGLAGYDYWVSYKIDYYPIDKNQTERQYEFFLTHLPGASGRFQEPVEIRTKSLILSTIYNSSVIYTNGESFILTDG